MAWIELHQSLPTHRKTIECAAMLDISLPQMIGHLCCFWLWALDNSNDGVLSQLRNATVALASRWQGDPDEFVNALIATNFLEKDGENLIIHDWYDYAGRLLEQREANRERQRRYREKKKSDSENSNSDVTVTNTLCNGATVPNRTIPNHTIPNLKKEEQEILAVLQSVKNYPYDEPTDLECIRKLAADYPEVDLLQEIKHWATWVIDKPLKKKGESRPRSQIRNWVRKAKEFQQRDRNKNTRRPKDRRSQSFEDYMQEAMDYAPE